MARVAWTLADLAGADAPHIGHVLEALHLRTDGALPPARNVA